jgi:hypothetical protein
MLRSMKDTSDISIVDIADPEQSIEDMYKAFFKVYELNREKIVIDSISKRFNKAYDIFKRLCFKENEYLNNQEKGFVLDDIKDIEKQLISMRSDFMNVIDDLTIEILKKCDVKDICTIYKVTDKEGRSTVNQLYYKLLSINAPLVIAKYRPVIILTTASKMFFKTHFTRQDNKAEKINIFEIISSKIDSSSRDNISFKYLNAPEIDQDLFIKEEFLEIDKTLII